MPKNACSNTAQKKISEDRQDQKVSNHKIRQFW